MHVLKQYRLKNVDTMMIHETSVKLEKIVYFTILMIQPYAGNTKITINTATP